MSKKVVLIITVVIVAVIVIYLLVTRNNNENSLLPTLETIGVDSSTITKTGSVDEHEDGCFYVWHNEKSDDITSDLGSAVSMDVFRLCPSGEKNWEKDKGTNVNHVLWFTSENDKEIPTLYKGDQLLYVSSTEIPFEGISWERYADYGYSIGVSNLIGDKRGHYHINNPDGKGFKGYIYDKSDASELNQFSTISDLFLDKVGSSDVRDNLVSDGGTISNLEKNGAYICEWYTGSFYQDFKMVANIHPFCAFETYTTYNYEFLHSSCIAIEIPKWFKTGYYYANDIGFFRYVAGNDSSSYNGEAYDPFISWNEPVIIKDDNGNVVYNPSTGYISPGLDSENIYTRDEKNTATISSVNNPYSDLYSLNQNSQEEDETDYSIGDRGLGGLDEGEYIASPSR